MNQPICDKIFITSTGKQNIISVIKGDIAQVPTQAMIAPINSRGLWFGGIDNVIRLNCGDQFHDQAENRMPLYHLDTIVAKKRIAHQAQFQDVVFVIDDLKSDLHKVVYAALQAAGEAGYTKVSLPAIRTGVMLGIVEKDAKTAVDELGKGITSYYKDFPDSPISNITFVVYERANEEILKLLQNSLSLI